MSSEKTPDRYSELVAAVDRNHLRTQFDVIVWIVGKYGVATDDDVNMVWKLYEDGFVD